MARRKLPTCFVVMPFGKKIVGDFEIDFDLIYEEYIEPAGKLASHETFRADTDKAGGLIIPAMMRSIYRSDLVVTEVSYYNPNVYYELGIRHALCRHGTLIVRRKSGDLGIRKLGRWSRSNPEAIPTPFDINGLTIWPYDFSKKNLKGEAGKLAERMTAASRATETDSPVFHHIPNLRVSAGASPAKGRKDRTYELTNARGKFIGYRSGDIANLQGGEAVDYWVNSENTMMQMARMYERSVSSTIRYLGARDPDPNSANFEDTIADDLKRAMGNRHRVEPGEVLVTTSGRLAQTHGVKAVLHAATVTGAPGKGFSTIPDDQLSDTVERVIGTARELIRRSEPAASGQSLIMPLFGTGQARRDPSTIAGQLIYSAIDSLARDPGADLAGRDLNLVLFSAFGDDDIALLQRLFANYVAAGELERVSKGDAG